MAVAIIVGWGLSVLGMALMRDWDARRREWEAAEAKRRFGLAENEAGGITPDHPKYRQFVDYALDLYNPAKPTVRLSDILGSVWTGFKWFASMVITACFVFTVVKAGKGQWEILHNWWLYPVWVAVYFALFNLYVQFSILVTGHSPGYCKYNRDNFLKALEVVESTHAANRSLHGN